MDGNTGLLRRTEPLAVRNKPWWMLLLAIAAGLVLTVVASSLYSGWDSALPETNLDELNAKIAQEGNDARYLVLTDVFGFLPGFVLILGGLNLLIRRIPNLPRWFFRSSGIVLGILGLAALFNLAADVVLLGLLGAGDLSSDPVEVSSGGYSTWGAIGAIFNVFLTIALLGTVLHGVTALVLAAGQRVRRR